MTLSAADASSSARAAAKTAAFLQHRVS